MPADILLTADGDIKLSDIGDISLTESIRQQVLIHLRWIRDEWRLGPDLGFTWFEDVLVKRPNLDNIQQLIREEIMKVDGVTDAEVEDAVYDPKNRTARFPFMFCIGADSYKEEVTIHV